MINCITIINYYHSCTDNFIITFVYYVECLSIATTFIISSNLTAEENLEHLVHLE